MFVNGVMTNLLFCKSDICRYIYLAANITFAGTQICHKTWLSSSKKIQRPHNGNHRQRHASICMLFAMKAFGWLFVFLGTWWGIPTCKVIGIRHKHIGAPKLYCRSQTYLDEDHTELKQLLRLCTTGHCTLDDVCACLCPFHTMPLFGDHQGKYHPFQVRPKSWGSNPTIRLWFHKHSHESKWSFENNKQNGTEQWWNSMHHLW